MAHDIGVALAIHMKLKIGFCGKHISFGKKRFKGQRMVRIRMADDAIHIKNNCFFHGLIGCNEIAKLSKG
jgi:hypothetical protein